jgi:hypothetical protein
MNLLSIQDTLKNASDQQLVRLMQSPDSTAPSYLVLSELRRRKEMRTKQAQPPEGTVAQDLTKDERTYADQEGIRSLRMPGYEDEAQAAERNPDDGIEAMREGGVVRMSGGEEVEGEGEGEIPAITFGRNVLQGAGNVARGLVTPDAEMARRVELERARNFFGNQSNGFSWFTTGANTRNRNAGYLEYLNRNANNPNLDIQAFRANPEEYIKNNPFTTPAAAPPATAPAAAAPAATAPAGTTTPPPAPRASSFTPEIFQGPSGTTAPPGAAAPPGRAGNAPATGGGGGRGGGGGGAAAPAGSSIRALTPDGEAPNMQTIMERNLGLLPGMPQELLDRIKSSRTNEGERRREAQNMALLEAGLRIAASRNPSLAGAIGEGATPAVQAYGQQLSQIRQDQRADLQTEMAAAQFDLQRRYAAGQISATEYRTALTELGAYRRSAMQIAAENARHGASLGSASADRAAARQENIAARRGRGDFTPEELATMSPELRTIAERQQELRHPRNADVSGMSPLVAALRPEITAIRTRMEALGPRPSDTTGIFGSSVNTRAAQWDREMKALRDELEPLEAARNRAINGVLSPRVNGPRVSGAGTTPPPPPGYGILP